MASRGRKPKSSDGARSNQVRVIATDVEKERLERLRAKYNLSQPDMIHIALFIFDTMSEDERKKWLRLVYGL